MMELLEKFNLKRQNGRQVHSICFPLVTELAALIE